MGFWDGVMGMPWFFPDLPGPCQASIEMKRPGEIIPEPAKRVLHSEGVSSREIKVSDLLMS